MFLVFGKCRFLLRWQNVFSVSHVLSQVTSPLLVRWYPLIDRLLSGTYPVNVRFSRYMFSTHAVIAWLLGSTYRLREPRAAEEKNFVTG